MEVKLKVFLKEGPLGIDFLSGGPAKMGIYLPVIFGTLMFKRSKMATRNREPQEYSRSRIGRYLPGSLYSNYISTRFLGFPVLGGSHFLPFNLETPREQEELEKEDDADFREAIVEPGIVCQVFLNPKGR